jgi:hypothetical protein
MRSLPSYMLHGFSCSFKKYNEDKNDGARKTVNQYTKLSVATDGQTNAALNRTVYMYVLCT